MDDQKIYREIIALCQFKGDVIDFGCGSGSWLPALSEQCDSVTAIDCAQFMLDDAAARNLPNVKLKLANTLSDQPSQSADGIVCTGTLQILSSGNEWLDFFAQAKRVLKPSGILLIDVPTPRLPRDHFIAGEGFKNIATNGWRFGLERQLGWLLLWVRGVSRNSISGSKAFYAVKPRAVEDLISRSGFEIVLGPDVFLHGTRSAKLSGTGSPDKNSPRYAWWLLSSEVIPPTATSDQRASIV